MINLPRFILIFLLFLLFLLILAIVRKLWQVSRARYHGSPHTVITGVVPSASDSSPRIPLIIWTYWHSPELPPLVARCIDNWRRESPRHEIRLLHAGNFHLYLPAGTVPLKFAELPPYRQADWLRIQLLQHHGGLWMDATIILTGSLDWVHQSQQQNGAEFVGFYINAFTADLQHPMVENWFLAAVPGSRFVQDWARELDDAVIVGNEDNYLQNLKATGEFTRVVQSMPEGGHHYLVMHLAASRIQQREAVPYKLHLLRAEDEAFCFHAPLRWHKHELYFRLGIMSCPNALPRLIKLRGNDRRVFEKFIKKGWVTRKSALGVLLYTPGSDNR